MEDGSGVVVVLINQTNIGLINQHHTIVYTIIPK